jgi:hypothetical protein
MKDKEYFSKKYQDLQDKVFTEFPETDDSLETIEEEYGGMSPEEIVGHYIVSYDEDALEVWTDNCVGDVYVEVPSKSCDGTRDIKWKDSDEFVTKELTRLYS